MGHDPSPVRQTSLGEKSTRDNMGLLDSIFDRLAVHRDSSVPKPAPRPEPKSMPPMRTFAHMFPHLASSPSFRVPVSPQPELSSPITIVRNGVKAVLPPPANVFGAAARTSKLAGEAARTPLPAGASDEQAPPSKRVCHHPDQQERTDTLTSKSAIYDALAGVDEHGTKHELAQCEHSFEWGGELWPCFHMLYGKNPTAAYNELERKRKEFLSPALGSKGRGQEIMENLCRPCVDGGQTEGPCKDVWFQVS